MSDQQQQDADRAALKKALKRNSIERIEFVVPGTATISFNPPASALDAVVILKGIALLGFSGLAELLTEAD